MFAVYLVPGYARRVRKSGKPSDRREGSGLAASESVRKSGKPLTAGKSRACRLRGVLAYIMLYNTNIYSVLFFPVVFFMLMIYNNRGTIFYCGVEFF
jgi:hypothetical protein